MERPASILITALAVALLPTNEATGHSLQLDGRFHVQGASLRTAQVTVSRDEQAMQVLTRDLRQLNLELDLQEVYVLTFEREGCRSKSILFDTRMASVEAAQGPFTFRFDVTLEPSPDEAVRYAGPVGYVSYSSTLEDFDYDVDYRLTHDEKGRLLTAAPSSPDAVSVSGKRARAERRRVEPFIDPTLEMERAQQRARDATTEAGEDEQCRLSFAAYFPTEGIRAVSHAVAPRYASELQHRSVVIEQEREITIVRVSDGPLLIDYRCIRHSNGTTWHYRNGSNCTYEEFMAAVGEP